MSSVLPSPALRDLASMCRAAIEGIDMAGNAPRLTTPALAARHRVGGLFAAATGDRAVVEATTAANLAKAAEYRRLARGLAAVEPVFLKGLAVAALGYANPLLKQSADIDLLVDERHAAAAAGVLEALGYRLATPASHDRLHRWYRVSNQSVWTQGSKVVELHVRPLVVPFHPSAPVRFVPMAPGIEVATFGDEDLYAYLVLHGALSGWFRLKWLADLFAFLRQRQDRVGTFHDVAGRHGATDASGAALLLLEALFDFHPPSPPAYSRTAGRLASLALGLLEHGEPTARRFGTLPIHRSLALLQPRPGALARRAYALAAQRWLA